ncbi:MAG TPA: OsmC family protein [Anaerolineae bacterium]
MKTATLTWVDGQQFVGRAGSGHGVIIDTGTEGGGHNAGPGPMELLLLGVLGCTGMDVISILKKKRQNVTGLKITAAGEQAKETPHYYTRIELDYVAFGDVDEEALRRSIELSETKYCSAMATLNGKTQFSTRYHVEKAAASVEPAVTG